MKLKAGFARADITPPVGTGLSGFGPFLQRRATTVRSPLCARAMAVDDGKSRWVIVSCDLLGLSDQLVQKVSRLVNEHTGWSPSEVAVHATHNHSGPATAGVNIGWGEPDPLYLLQLPHHIAVACMHAIEDLAPVSVHHAEVPVTRFSHSRMRPTPGLSNAAALRSVWETDRPDLVDTTTHVFRIDDSSGSMRGFLSYFSCHPVICCESSTAIHGDFPSEALQEIESRYPEAVGVFLQGALGDINPNYAHGPENESYQALTLFGRRFADCIQYGLDNTVPVTGVRVASSKSEIEYEFGPYSLDKLVDRLKESTDRALDCDLAAPTTDAAFSGVLAISLEEIIRRIQHGEDIRRPVHVISLAFGPFVFTGVNLELFHGIKRRHQQEFGPQCLLLSVTNGYRGYGPTRDAFHPGMPPYPAYEVPFFLAQLPFNDDIEESILAGARTTVLAATGRV